MPPHPSGHWGAGMKGTIKMSESKQELFMKRMAKILNGEDFTMESELNYLENWDSLASVDFLGMADEDFGKELDPMDVRMAGTIGDLFELVTKEG